MFHTKAGVLDRIGQSFSLFMQAPIALVLPLAVFNIVMTLALPAIIFAFFPLTNIDTQNISVLISLIVSLTLVYVIIYITLLIPISNSIIKSTFDIIRQKPVNIQSNIAYGFSKLGSIFKIYWYMFEYAYLYPALGVILGGILMIGGMLTENELLSIISYITLVLAIMWGIVWGIYRGVKTSFSITHSLFEDNFEKTAFRTSIAITKNIWWRIVGNLLLVGIIAGLLTGLVSGLINSISLLNTDVESLLQINQDSQSLENILGNIGDFHPISFITEVISSFLGSILAAFMIVFIVVFYLRLRAEYNSLSSEGHIQATETKNPTKNTKHIEL